MAQFRVPTYIFTGKNALKEAIPVLLAAGKRALIVTGPHVGKSPMMDVLIRNLLEFNLSYVIFDRITSEPTVPMIEDGVAVYRASGCDFLIGIGGGSPLDAAKAIAFLCDSPGKLSDYCGKILDAKLPPVFAIPTTAGTGSEVTKFTIITDVERNVKMLLKGDCLIPHAAIVDPAFTMDMPKSITAATGLDALTHAIESYVSLRATPLTDALALSAVRRINAHLPDAYAYGTVKAREEMSVASLEAGICINNASVTLVHGLSRPIGALFHVPHGLSNAMLLTVCLNFSLSGAQKRFADLAVAIGVATREDPAEIAATKFVERIDELVRSCEVPTLAGYGVDREAFYNAIAKMSADALASGSPQNTRRPITAEDCQQIYRQIYS